jgi:hypothetical protein
MKLIEARKAFLFLNMKREHKSCDGDLWFSVLCRGILDVFGLSLDKANESLRVIKKDALRWMGSQDFVTVCDLAGLNSEYVISILFEIKDAASSAEVAAQRKQRIEEARLMEKAAKELSITALASRFQVHVNQVWKISRQLEVRVDAETKAQISKELARRDEYLRAAKELRGAA